jgi:DNA-directed RNA polymerase specialized sigma24 family protein
MSDLLNDAFEAALRGDREALGNLLSILKTRYGQSCFTPLRSHRGDARPSGPAPSFQPTVSEFLEEIKGRATHELSEPERGEVLRFFTSFCDRNLDQHRKGSALLRPPTDAARPASEPRRNPATSVPSALSAKREEHWRLLQGEISALDAFDRLILERYLAGVSLSNMAKETGRKVAALEIHITRIKQRIADRLALQSSITGTRTDPPPLPDREASCAPRRQEILRALEDLPVEAQAAIDFVHIKGRTIVDLARTLGDRGLEKAQARLELGYESLARRLDIPFPESFEFLKL